MKIIILLILLILSNSLFCIDKNFMQNFQNTINTKDLEKLKEFFFLEIIGIIHLMIKKYGLMSIKIFTANLRI